MRKQSKIKGILKAIGRFFGDGEMKTYQMSEKDFNDLATPEFKRDPYAPEGKTLWVIEWRKLF